MMRILLYNAQGGGIDSPYEEFVATLANDLSTSFEVVAVHSAKEMGDHPLNEFQLVHVFGCWNTAATALLLRAESKNIPTVLSPLGGLQPWHIRQHQQQWQRRRQRQTAEKASAVHVCGQLERDTFEKLGWNKKVVTIKNPIFTSLISHDECARQFVSLYRKVIDSNAARLLREKSRQAMGQLLQLGIDDFVLHNTERIDNLKALLPTLTEEDWRLMTLYAADEHVLGPMGLGLQRVGYPLPELNVNEIDRFPSEAKYVEGHLKADALLSRNLLMKSRLHDYVYEKEKSERKLAIMIANLRYEMEHQSAPLLHLLDLYEALRFEDVDEDRLVEILKIIAIEGFAAHIMGVTHRVLGLTEGFMPMSPKDDKETDLMVRFITKFSI